MTTMTTAFPNTERMNERKKARESYVVVVQQSVTNDNYRYPYLTPYLHAAEGKRIAGNFYR